jgi:hypothetical protein
VRDQGGMRIKGVVGDRTMVRWYSFDECCQLVARHAAEQAAAAQPEPEPVLAAPRRRGWPPTWISLALLIGAGTVALGWAGHVGGFL